MQDLLTKIQIVSKQALEIGSLLPIATSVELTQQQGIAFVVRQLANIQRKQAAAKKQAPDFNPFLPYDETLFVEEISATHVCLLNKFKVVDDHILIVTKEFESQNNLLSLADFSATLECLNAMNGLAFYNGGKEAGASQKHKHLQVVPYPFFKENSYSLLDAYAAADPIVTYQYRFQTLADNPSSQDLYLLYLQQMLSLSLIAQVPANGETVEVTRPYNLILTKEWICVIPRSQESFNGVSINSLGLCGTLLVKDDQQKAQLLDIGPLAFLNGVTCS